MTTLTTNKLSMSSIVPKATGRGTNLMTNKDRKIEQTYSTSSGLVRRLASLNVSFAFSSYQSNTLYLVGRNKNNGINVHQAMVQRPMGLHVQKSGDRVDMAGGLTVTAGHQVIRFENTLQPGQEINHTFDACLTPRMVHFTGSLDAHDVGVDDLDRPIFVNTRFNCLAEPGHKYSFEKVWMPSFVSALIDEDRCHLNGLAMQDGKPKYVTAVSRSNTIDGWRDRRNGGGVIIDVDSDQIVCDGLSMPHSPRVHNGQLWVLNSGTGELGRVPLEGSDKGRFIPLAFCPGFLRGLSFQGDLAFVGLSKPRYKRFEGLPLDQRLKDADSEPWCGVQIIDLNTGSCVDWFRIDGDVAELYDVEVLPGTVCPMAISPSSNELETLVTYDGMMAGTCES